MILFLIIIISPDIKENVLYFVHSIIVTIWLRKASPTKGKEKLSKDDSLVGKDVRN